MKTKSKSIQNEVLTLGKLLEDREKTRQKAGLISCGAPQCPGAADQSEWLDYGMVSEETDWSTDAHFLQFFRSSLLNLKSEICF